MKDNEKKLPIIEAIEKHPHLVDRSLLTRVRDLLANRAPELTRRLSSPAYNPDNRAIRRADATGVPTPQNHLLPAEAAEELLGLEPGDMKQFVELGIIEDPFPTSDCAPWITISDILAILSGDAPGVEADRNEIKRGAICVSRYRIENDDGDIDYVVADVDYIHRLRPLFGDERDSHIDRLDSLCDHEDQTISCAMAEHLLNLRRGDLELLAECGVIPLVVPEGKESERADFFVMDLIQFIDGEIYFEIKPVPYNQ